jgi:hypothetical protein
MSDEELLLARTSSEMGNACNPQIETFVNTFEGYKKAIHETAGQYTKYEPNTQEKLLSNCIFNNHVRNLQDTLLEFLKFVKRDSFEGGFRTLPPGEWYKYYGATCSPTFVSEMFMRYNPSGEGDKHAEEAGFCVKRMDTIVDNVLEEFEHMRNEFWREADKPDNSMTEQNNS